MALAEHFKGGEAYVWKDTFAIIKAKKPLQGALAVIQDKNEITVIIAQSKANSNDVLEIKKAGGQSPLKSFLHLR